MAAESAGLSTSLDRHLFLRVLIEAILYGEPDFEEDWRAKLKIAIGFNIVTEIKRCS